MTSESIDRYWYLVTVEECPVCGHTYSYRTRMKTPRPSEWIDRHEFIATYNYCNE